MPETAPVLAIDQGVARITLSRPSVANRLSPGDLQVLCEHLDAIDRLPEVLVLQFVGTGKYFCSGYDITALNAAPQGGAVAFGAAIDRIERARPVTIAAVNGGVYGGATDLCLACDFRIGVPECDMFMPAARLGLHFYEGGLRRYVSRLGIDMAKRLFLTGQKLDAQAMRDCGFLTDLVPATELDQHLKSLTATLSAMAPIALLGMKKHLNDIARGALDITALERDIAMADASGDLQEGASAWKEKRTPIFKGK